MYPYITISGIRIISWPVFLAIGYIAALLSMLKFRPADFSLSRGKISLCALTYMFSSWIGGGILHLIIHPELYTGLTPRDAISRLGVASLGGMAGGILALWILSKNTKFSFMDFADFGAPYIMLIEAFGRIGCIFAGCCWGVATKLPWGFVFLEDGVNRHPTQAYAMAIAFAVFGSSRFIYKELRKHKGLTFYYMIFMYSFLRFFNEFLRAEGPFIIWRLKIIHPFLVLFMAIAIFGMAKSLKLPASKEPVSINSIFTGAILRLFIWMFSSVVFPLAIIIIANRIWF